MEELAGVKVYAPATVANVSVGYDVLGFAINGPGDDIIVRKGSEPGLKIFSIHGAKNKLPKDPKRNTATVAGQALLDHLGYSDMPIEMEIYKKMPFASGMGSSAASAVAGVFGINEYLGAPLTKRELLPFAMLGEQVADGAYHADNVAPCLMGGIILIRDNQEHDIIKLPSPEGLYACVIHPFISILTSESREILSENVSLEKVIKQTGNMGAFVASLYRADFDLLERCLEDHIIEPQRAKLIPHFYALKEIAMKRKAMGFSISGAGPSLYALCRNSLIAEEISEAIKKHLKQNKIGCDTYISLINNEGAKKY